eukprot:TRINITY_DN303_c0_g2_i3.p1 TRINITY_DN303_c0_g2~~TRINITY_DN303_c0_g2_i3.p1  ORF type:complete len:418 (+),score=56.22 TRINITY_DN303_c0_g2_i3:142-1395(+)
MNALCNICDAYEAALYCEDCPKFHLYCEDCYNASHKADNKKHHKVEKYNPESKAVFAAIYCKDHPKKEKEYVCLKCDESVCSDCVILGKHKGHSTGSFETGFEKMLANFKDCARECEEKVKSSVGLENTILKLRKIKEETESGFAALKDMVNKKSIEIISVIDSAIKEKESIESGVKTAIQSGLNIVESAKPIGCANYDSLCEITAKLKEGYVKEEELEINPITINFEGVMESLKKIVLTKEMLYVNNLVLPVENELIKSQIVKDQDDIKLLLEWVSEQQNGNRIKGINLLMSGSVNGFDKATFASLCYEKGPMLVIILSDYGKVFGGFAMQLYNHGGSAKGAGSFVYSLTAKVKCPSKITKESERIIVPEFFENVCIAFGDCYETIQIVKDCNTTSSPQKSRYFIKFQAKKTAFIH